ncbi:hypothetical protein IP84_06675 [beta proteobacterium AAP99]|nr:hypothetical protein IP84_06675 [beta proteobacterium AAP99]
MKETELLESALSSIKTDEQFLVLHKRLSEVDVETVFVGLWQTALAGRGNSASVQASRMLVALQPDAPRSLEELIRDIHASKLDASNRLVPFYLVTQFGKHAVTVEALRFLDELPIGSDRSRVECVNYWASAPAELLCQPLHDWRDSGD